MPGIVIGCPHCQASLKMNKTPPATMDLRCPKCKKTFTMQTAVNKANHAIRAGAPSNGAAFADLDSRSGNGSSDSERRRGGSPMRYVLVGVVVVFVVALAGIIWSMRSESPIKDNGKNVEKKGDEKDPPEPGGPFFDEPHGLGPKGLASVSAEDQEVTDMKNRGIAYLHEAIKRGGDQDLGGKGWTRYAMTFAGLTLLESGVSPTHASIQKVLKQVRAEAAGTNFTYGTSIDILFLDSYIDKVVGKPKVDKKDKNKPPVIDPEKAAVVAEDVALLQRLSLRLMAGQLPAGVWTYETLGDFQVSFTANDEQALWQLLKDMGKTPWKEFRAKNPERVRNLSPTVLKLTVLNVDDDAPPEFFRMPGRGDHSNTQFALLALWAARRHDVPVDRSLKLIVKRFQATQDKDDGHWPYKLDGNKGEKPSPSMTCAGLLALAVGHDMAAPPKKKNSKDESAAPVQDKAVKDALGYVATGMNANRNIYFIWSVERVGVLFKADKIEGRNWYPWGLAILKPSQHKEGKWHFGKDDGYSPMVDTCFALLFLQKVNLMKDMSSKFDLLEAAPAAPPAVGRKE